MTILLSNFFIFYVLLSICGHTTECITILQMQFDHETAENKIKRLLLFQEKTDLESCGCLQGKTVESFIRNSSLVY